MIEWIALVVVAAIGVACVFSAHIPDLRNLTGAAPLQPQEPDPARDFARTVGASHLETAEQYAARMDREGR